MPLQQTSGNVTADAYAGGTAAKVNYIEDFFQSYLRTGTGASATVTTGLDGSTKETLVWTKSRSAATNHKLTDNVRGATKALSSNTTDAEATDSQGLTAFSATGYTIGTNTDYNNSGATYVDWQWVSQPKFFDVVTYTGNGVATTIAHNLGSVPGSIIVKRTDAAGYNWFVYHVSLGNSSGIVLNDTGGSSGYGTALWNSTNPTSTVFSLGTNSNVNASGGTYVAYLFAHNAGGFGLTGTDNVISCGSYTRSGSSLINVNFGYEAQWVLIKNTTAADDWYLFDNMRGIPLSGSAKYLNPNLANAESSLTAPVVYPTATGFTVDPASGIAGADGNTSIYIAIRRGPMKVPTLGTSVFSPNVQTGTTNPQTITTGFSVDLSIQRPKNSTYSTFVVDRLRGISPTSTSYLLTNYTDSEVDGGAGLSVASNTAIIDSGWWLSNGIIWWNFRRAPSFFDEVCWTGNNSTNQRVSHNLGVVPELIIYKGRNKVNYWRVYFGSINTYIQLDAGIAAVSSSNFWGSSAPTTTDFGINCGSMDLDNFNAVAYLFATCPGVSKVGSYTGNGSTQTINCGFTSGARFVLIKRTDSTGDWYTYDTARGMTSGTDPYLRLNSTAAEVATAGSVTTVATGFALNSAILAAINVSGGTYIFLAIA